MAQMIKGARALVDTLTELAAVGRRYATECDLAEIKTNPLLVQDVLIDIDATFAKIQRLIQDELMPMLERQGGRTAVTELTEQLVLALERLDAVERQITDLQRDRSVVPFRRKRS